MKVLLQFPRAHHTAKDRVPPGNSGAYSSGDDITYWQGKYRGEEGGRGKSMLHRAVDAIQHGGLTYLYISVSPAACSLEMP